MTTLTGKHMQATKPGLYGIVAEFEYPDDLLSASNKAREAGYKQMEAYTPFPVHGLTEALGKQHTKLQWIVLCAAFIGGCGGYFMEYWVAVIDYAINIGGKPLHSWPMFLPVTFELTVLFSALTAAGSMLVLNGLPEPYHPLFQVEGFFRSTSDRFFLCIESEDGKFDPAATRAFLESLEPISVNEVAP